MSGMLRAKSRISIEKYRDGNLVERRETENVLRTRGAWYFIDVAWWSSGTWKRPYTITRLVIAKDDKTTIKWLKASAVTMEEDTAALRWIAKVRWVDISADAYTIYYIGLMKDDETPSAGANNITGSTASYFAAKIDPPVTKSAEESIAVEWMIAIPYSEVT